MIPIEQQNENMRQEFSNKDDQNDQPIRHHNGYNPRAREFTPGNHQSVDTLRGIGRGDSNLNF